MTHRAAAPGFLEATPLDDEAGTSCLAVALFDYNAVETDELAFRSGERMVVYGSPEEGWLECELGGRIGMVPANYVRLLQKEEASKRNEDEGGGGQLGNMRRIKSAENLNGGAGGEEVGWESSNDTLSKRRQVYERLYHQGLVKVKRQQNMQEEKRIREDSQLRQEQVKNVNARSMKMSADRKPDRGDNYGEFLYNEGLERRDIKAEQVRLIKHNEQREEEKEATFKPRISTESKRLRRDMPVVERLFMLEQVKAEKIDSLKRQILQSEKAQATFSPRVNPDYLLKQQLTDKQMRADLERSHLDTHKKKESQRLEMQQRLDREQGITHQPTLCGRSRKLAKKATNRMITDKGEAGEGDIFQRLYKEAEEREMRSEVKRIEAHLLALDLASSRGGRGGEDGSVSPVSVGIENGGTAADGEPTVWERMHAEEEQMKARKRDLERRVKEDRRVERIKNAKSDEISQKRIRRESRGILQQMGFIQQDSRDDAGYLVSFNEFAIALEKIVENYPMAAVMRELEEENSQQKDQIYNTLWAQIAQLRPAEDSGDEEADSEVGEALPADRLVDLILHSSRSDLAHVDRESQIDRLCRDLVLILADEVSVRRLSTANKPVHLLVSERQSLLHRQQQLKTAAAAEFAKIIKDLAGNMNELEIQALFEYYDMSTNTLKYAEFGSRAKKILSPRRKAIVRIFQKIDTRHHGSVLVSELRVERGMKTPRGRPVSAVCTEKESALENIAKKMNDIRIRLKELAEMIPKNEEKGKGENRWGATKGIVVGGRGGIGSSLSSLSEEGVMGATRRKSVSVDASECTELDLRQKSPIAQAGHRSMHRRQPSSDGLESVPISVTSFRRQQIKFDGQADQVPRHEYLHQLWRKKFQVMFAARQAQDEKEMQHCTFRPFTNAAGPKVDRDGPVGERLYYESKNKDSKSDERRIRSFEERELEQCTFQPNLVSRRPKSARGAGERERRGMSPPAIEAGSVCGGVKDARSTTYKEAAAQRHIDRTRRASAVRLQAAAGEGKYADMQVPASKTPRGSSDKTPRGDKTPRELKRGVGEKFPATAATSTARPPTFLTEHRKQTKAQPLLCVDINLGNGQVGRVAINDGDTGANLARDFCKTYSLDDNICEILARTLQEQIDALTLT